MPLDLLLLTEDDYPPENDWFSETERVVRPNQNFRIPHELHLSIVLLASAMRRQRFTVALCDNFLHFPAQAKRFDEYLSLRPKAVGLSTTFISSESTFLKIVRRIRKASPGSKIVLGGPTNFVYPDWRRHVDVTVLYEGEIVLPAVLNAIKKGTPLEEVPGIEISQGGRQETTPPAPLLPMADYPMVDWDLLDRDGRSFYSIETQRGCVYKCRYCTYPVYSPGKPDGSGVRLRPVADVIDEMKRNCELYGMHHFMIADSTFTFPRKHAEEVCREIIRHRIPVKWQCYGRVDNISEELASLMTEAGCRHIFFGIESGDGEMLRRMRKDFTVDDIYAGLASTHRAGIMSTAGIIIGFPGETEETVANTEKMLLQAGLTFVRMGIFWFDHNAPVRENAAAFQLSGWKEQWSHKTMDSARATALMREMNKRVLTSNATRPGGLRLAPLVNNGLTFDEGVSFLLARGLLAAYNLAKQEKAPLGCFDIKAVNAARLEYPRLSMKMFQKHRDHFFSPQSYLA